MEPLFCSICIAECHLEGCVLCTCCPPSDSLSKQQSMSKHINVSVAHNAAFDAAPVDKACMCCAMHKLCLSAGNSLLPHCTWMCPLAGGDGHILMLNTVHCILNTSMMCSVVCYGRTGRALHTHQSSSSIKTGRAVCCWPRYPSR